MDGTAIPKERTIFDASLYDEDFLRDYLEDDYELHKDDLEAGFDDYVAFKREEGILDVLMATDYEDELAQLKSFFSGGTDFGATGKHVGNTIIARGSSGRWNGTGHGFSLFPDLTAALDTSPSRYGADNILADCEIDKIWDENGHLFVTGAHHDGRVTVELRQLTDLGEHALDIIEDAWVGEPFTVFDKSYDGSERSVSEAMRDLWDNPDFAPLPRYMELDFGCPAEEYEEPSIDPSPVAGVKNRDAEPNSKEMEPVLDSTWMECGTFTAHGFGFHRDAGDHVDYKIACPVNPSAGTWALLEGAYSLNDEDRDDFCDAEYVGLILEANGLESRDELGESKSQPNPALTRMIAAVQEGNRFSVWNTTRSDAALLSAFSHTGVGDGRVMELMDDARKSALVAEGGVSVLEESSRTASQSLDAGIEAHGDREL